MNDKSVEERLQSLEERVKELERWTARSIIPVGAAPYPHPLPRVEQPSLRFCPLCCQWDMPHSHVTCGEIR